MYLTRRNTHAFRRAINSSREGLSNRGHLIAEMMYDSADTTETVEIPPAKTIEISYVRPSEPKDKIMNSNLSMDFVWAGRAIFTVSSKTGEHYTYRVNKQVEESRTDRDRILYFVGLLIGPDNTSDYTYLGVLEDTGLRLTRASKLDSDSKPVRVFDWALRVIKGEQILPQGYMIEHAGRCGSCGRMLTDPESLRTGIGPVCREK